MTPGSQPSGGNEEPRYSAHYDEPLSDEPRHRDLLAWWEGKRGERQVPTRSELNPAELRAHMGSLELIEVVEGDDYRYRLLGTHITEAYGRDSTGKTVRELYADDPALLCFLLGMYRTVASRGVVGRSQGDLGTVGREYRRFDGLLLPLARDDGEVGWLLGQLLFE